MADITTKLVVSAASAGGEAPADVTMQQMLAGSTTVPGAFSGSFDGTLGGNTPAPATVTGLTVQGEATLTALNGITAHANGGRPNAVLLSKQFNRIAVCATAADSVVLPAAVVGDFRVAVNDGVAAAQVFGNGSDTIDGVAGATGVPLTNGKRAIFFCLAAGVWSSLSAGVSA